MGKYGSEILELKIEKDRLMEDTKRHETEFKCERRKEYEGKIWRKKKQRFNESCYLIKQSFQIFLEAAGQFSI